MRIETVRATNDFLLRTALSLIIVEQGFKNTLMDSVRDEVQYPFIWSDLSGYIRVIGHPHINLRRAIAKEDLLLQLSFSIPYHCEGGLCEKITVKHRDWKFTFVITKYERNQEHMFVMVDDPLPLPEKEVLGRYIELTIEYSGN